ncbi:MAG TPA: hypothetical protein VND65_10860 [Candidatus Binatia bacterium]|nr:hypothetical protein [Candidatus Binatia bacterium]
MKQRSTALSLMAALLVAACTVASAQEPVKDTMPAHPLYTTLAPRLSNEPAGPVTPLTTWNGSFVYKGVTYKYNMVGTTPSSGSSTTVNTFIIPIALSYKTSSGTTVFSPETLQSNGKSAVTNTVDSPIFQNMDWVSPKGTNLGTTQYEDAFQRGNFWGQVSSATGYHVLLGQPRVAPLQTITVPPADGSVGNEFGIKVGLADITWFDGQIQSIMTKLKTKITPNTFPIFITYDVYLTEGLCCIGGYHSSFGSSSAPQAYAHFTYIGTPGIFAQDVSALSHEAGEWLDDPLVVNTNGNPVQCGILEVGDPEEGFTNYGAFPYTLNGFTYNLQDLVYLEYFGAPTTTSVDGGAESFHDNPFGLGICNNGG